MGAFDLCGNVREWCEDGFEKELYRDRKDKRERDPVWRLGEDRVVRGGSFAAKYGHARHREPVEPRTPFSDVGIRVVWPPRKPR